MKIQRATLAPDELYKLLIIIALILGGIVRIMPVVMAGFPVNDGGMFYVMADELKANHFALPAFTNYNLSDIPYAYPPFGFYAAGLISSLFHISTLDVVRWLPPLVSTLSLLAFYLMANEILGSKIQAALATLFYGLTPTAFEWVIMGGGITRSFGFLFLFLTVTYANHLFTRTSSSLNAALTAIFGALVFLSHPETGIQAASISVLLWLFRGRNKKSFIYSGLVAVGVVMLTSPWWGTVLATHGLAPFKSAMQTNMNGSVVYYLLQLLMLQFGGGIFFRLTVAFGVVGVLAVLAQKKYLLPVWLVLPSLVAPRSAHWMVLIPIAMLAAYGFDKVIAPSLLSLRKREGAWLADRFVAASVFALAFYSFLNSAVFGLDLAGKSLPAADRETIAWVDGNIPQGNDFLLLTGQQFSMQDPFQEWFPALTNQHSQTTLQGLEWTLEKDFFARHYEMVDLQHCANVACIEVWTERTGRDHDYLLIKILPNGNSSGLQASFDMLLESIRNSTQYELVHETENAVIFLNTER